MCGIIGYSGKKEALPILIDGLKRLEYRGYDSAGVAVAHKKIKIVKAAGKIKELEKKIIDTDEIFGNLGIAHTRWATHGEASEYNAHPHTDCQKKVWLAHNGIIENYRELRDELKIRGHKFYSETDTEIIAHLIEDFYEGDLTLAVRKTLGVIKGAYGLVIIHEDEPEKIIAVRYGSPLAIGIGEEEIIIASDVSAIMNYTREVIYLEDGEMAEIEKGNFKIFNAHAEEIKKRIEVIKWNLEKQEKQDFEHFMIKEIFEQPEAVFNTIRGRTVIKTGNVKLGGLENVSDRLREINNIAIIACGTAKYAGQIGEYMLEEYSNISVKTYYASDFRYRIPILNDKTAVIAISQSGETADTLAAIKEAKDKDILTLGIINTVGSSIARIVDAGIYNHIGPEIAVASTKTFISQISIMALLAVMLGRQRGMRQETGKEILEALSDLPEKIFNILEQDEKIREISEEYYQYEHFAFLGRKYNYPVSQEGALKMKEISYIHAEAFQSGEMKHGPLAMISENFPSFFIALQDSIYKKNISNIEEIKSRGGKIIAIATEGDRKIEKQVDHVIYIPQTLEMLSPILSVIPLQLFAYHFGVLRGCDVDKPRNLAKSVTVE